MSSFVIPAEAGIRLFFPSAAQKAGGPRIKSGVTVWFGECDR